MRTSCPCMKEIHGLVATRLLWSDIWHQSLLSIKALMASKPLIREARPVQGIKIKLKILRKEVYNRKVLAEINFHKSTRCSKFNMFARECPRNKNMLVTKVMKSSSNNRKDRTIYWGEHTRWTWSSRTWIKQTGTLRTVTLIPILLGRSLESSIIF